MNSSTRYHWEEEAQCPLCDSDNIRRFNTYVDHGIEVEYEICGHCGMVFQSPHMDADSLATYYHEDYLYHHQGAEGVTSRETNVQALRAAHIVNVVSKYFDRVAYHLDIGSSTGKLLERAASVFGSYPIGIELAEEYRSYTLRLGIDTRPSLSDLPDSMRQKFDLVSLSHVIEHLPSPRKYLREIREQWITKDGYLIVETPNLFFHHSFEIPHLLSFHAGTLRTMLELSGFRILQLKGHGLPRSRTFPLYLLAIAQAGETPTRVNWPSSTGLHLKRCLGRLSYLSAAYLLKILRFGKKSQLEQLLDV
jgi:2-polyprenyl-3-methyl-5-hydroxy-6-metoxy-1,4-benzoquinol methylase